MESGPVEALEDRRRLSGLQQRPEIAAGGQLARQVRLLNLDRGPVEANHAQRGGRILRHRLDAQRAPRHFCEDGPPARIRGDAPRGAPALRDELPLREAVTLRIGEAKHDQRPLRGGARREPEARDEQGQRPQRAGPAPHVGVTS
jgi:hypothetical protein